LKEEWCLPTVSPEFVWRMEDVLDLYAEPYDPAYPVVCFDESPYQMISETRVPVPVEHGKPARIDYEYKREGTCNLFMFFQPLGGWRHVEVTARRTAKDYAQCMKDLVDVHYPDAVLISVVQDNLNTHTGAALYEAFAPAEARRILDKLDFRYTPKHGSWLNMAEVEIGVVLGQCLDQRIPDMATVRRKVSRWERRRNTAKAMVNWRFTTTKAREKLKRLYPS
jgi:DDE superfamily endonuclease